MRLKYIITLGLVSLLSFSVPKVAKAAPLSIVYDGVKHNYQDTLVKYRFNGKELKTANPGIIIDGISLAGLNDVFKKSGMGIDYKYKKADKTLTITNGKEKVVLTLGSLQAIVNEKAKLLPLAPRSVQFGKGKSAFYVPARFLAQTFGFDYQWDKKTGTASITGTVSPSKKKKGSKLIYHGKEHVYKNTKVLFLANKVGLNTSEKPGIYLNKTLMAPARELFLNDIVEGGYAFDKKKKTITVEFEENKLIMKLGSKNATLNKKKVKLKEAPFNVKFSFSGKNSNLIPIEDVCKLVGIELQKKGAIANLSLPVLKVENGPEVVGSSDVISGKSEEKKTPGKTEKKNNNEKKDPSISTSSNMNFMWGTPTPNTELFTGNVFLRGRLSDSYTPASTLADVLQLANGNGEKNDTYMIVSDYGFYDVNGVLFRNELRLTFNNMGAPEDKTFSFEPGGMAGQATSVIDRLNMKTSLSFSLNEMPLRYELSLSEDKRVLTVKFIRNTLTSIQGEYLKGGYGLTLKGLGALEVKASDRMDGESVKFIISGVGDGIGTQSIVNEVLQEGVKAVQYYREGDDLILFVTKSPTLGYYMTKGENEVKLIFANLQQLQYSIHIPTPIPASFYQIMDEDDYLNQRFRVKISGDVRTYLEANPLYYDSSKILSYHITSDGLGNTILTFYTNGMQAYRIYKTDSSIGIKVGKANEFYKKVLVIDPGHGGHDTGAKSVNKQYFEKDVVLAVGYTFFKEYVDDPDLKIYWTRTGDTFMELEDRAKFASRIGADLFVSVHANAAANRKASGTEVYYSTRNNVLQRNGLSSYVMASRFQQNLTSGMKTRNRGVKSNIFVVTNINTVPAVLLELGFMTNEKDIKMLISEEKQDEMAGILYQTISELFEQYPTGR